MTTLGDHSTGRDNNLNLIRMVAATGVLVSHAWPISLGPGVREPLYGLLGFTLGSLSVLAFFIISGFLIAASYERARTRRRFLAARTLRLFPGLIVSLLVVAFVMGPLVTTLPVGLYLSDPGVYTFLVQNTALIQPQYTLPGVFETNPYPTVEGSIWTLVHEVACYIGLFILGVMGVLQKRSVVTALFIAYLAAWLAVPIFEIDLHSKIEAFRRLSLPFAWGMVLYLWRDKIPMTLGIVLILTVLAWLLRDTPAYPIGLVMALGYTLFWLAYIPGGLIRAYNRIGDYSYGIYIYAFPAQGLAVWIFGPMTPLENIIASLPMTLICAIASWHVIEKPACCCTPAPRSRTPRNRRTNACCCACGCARTAGRWPPACCCTRAAPGSRSRTARERTIEPPTPADRRQTTTDRPRGDNVGTRGRSGCVSVGVRNR